MGTLCANHIILFKILERTFLNFFLEIKFHSVYIYVYICVCVHNYFLFLDLTKQTRICVINDFHYYSATHLVRS